MHIKFPAETSKQLGSSLGSTWFHLVLKPWKFPAETSKQLGSGLGSTWLLNLGDSKQRLAI